MMSREAVDPLTPELSSGVTAISSALWMVLLVDEGISKNVGDDLNQTVLEKREVAFTRDDQVVED